MRLIGGVLCQLSKDVCPGARRDVHIVRQGGAIRRGTGEGMLLGGIL